MQICSKSDSTPEGPEITATPVIEQFDLASDIQGFTSAMTDPTSALKSDQEWGMSVFSDKFSTMTASAASASSSLSLQLSTADAAGSTSIYSQISQIAADVSRASSALQAAQSAFNSPLSATSSSTGGVGCVQTAAVGMGALVGGMAALAHL
jgi:hypothetical protein